ncbi:MAG: diguanylate cyclase [Chromatiales bacterium]|nr:diguanylate cyclase [Chromatiales bacterium]
MAQQQSDELQGWKQRYYDAIGELEEREKRWGEVEQVLRQGLTRISLAADDADLELNRQLERMRNEIRKGVTSEALKAQLGVISESILRLDEARKAQAALPTPAELMLDMLGRIHFPHGMGHRSRELQKRLVKAQPAEFVAMGEAFSSLLSDALEWAAGEEGGVDAPAGEEKRGLIGKLFSGRERESGGATPAAESVGMELARGLLDELVRSLIRDERESGSLRERIALGQSEVQLQRLTSELAGLLNAMGEEGVSPTAEKNHPVEEVLLRLLERLEIPADLQQGVDAIKAMLQPQLPAEEVEGAIIAIAELVAEMRSRMMGEKAEIEAFLKQLTDRLQEIDSGFQSSVASQRDSYRDGRALDDAVTLQMEGIEESVRQAEELTILKQLIQQRVETIRDHMQAFRQAEDQRLQQAEQQVRELSEKLEKVQGESDRLRKRLHEERSAAMVDPLTGIPNRLAYNERMAQEFARWRRYGAPLTIAVWDVDKFKSVNDTYGHQAGDKVLSIVAKVLQQQIRETDFVARFGGEEFVLLLPETNLENAFVAAENLRQAVERTEFHFRGTRVPITISCGMSEFSQGDNQERVFERADKALYEAKNGGRNRCAKG